MMIIFIALISSLDLSSFGSDLIIQLSQCHQSDDAASLLLSIIALLDLPIDVAAE
jgi:hypothetical protein